MKNLNALKEQIRIFKELKNKFPKNKRYKKELNRYKSFAIREGLKVD